MRGGFNSSAIKRYLNRNWGLGSSRSDSVLLLGTTPEVVCENVRKLEAYVEEVASGDTVVVNIQKVQDDVLKLLLSVVNALPEISSDQKNHIKFLYEGVVPILNNPDFNLRSTPRSHCSSS